MGEKWVSEEIKKHTQRQAQRENVKKDRHKRMNGRNGKNELWYQCDSFGSDMLQQDVTVNSFLVFFYTHTYTHKLER